MTADLIRLLTHPFAFGPPLLASPTLAWLACRWIGEWRDERRFKRERGGDHGR